MAEPFEFLLVPAKTTARRQPLERPGDMEKTLMAEVGEVIDERAHPEFIRRGLARVDALVRLGLDVDGHGELHLLQCPDDGVGGCEYENPGELVLVDERDGLLDSSMIARIEAHDIEQVAGLPGPGARPLHDLRRTDLENLVHERANPVRPTGRE